MTNRIQIVLEIAAIVNRRRNHRQRKTIKIVNRRRNHRQRKTIKIVKQTIKRKNRMLNRQVPLNNKNLPVIMKSSNQPNRRS
jgi:hypothetical protein